MQCSYFGVIIQQYYIKNENILKMLHYEMTCLYIFLNINVLHSVLTSFFSYSASNHVLEQFLHNANQVLLKKNGIKVVF